MCIRDRVRKDVSENLGAGSSSVPETADPDPSCIVEDREVHSPRDDEQEFTTSDKPLEKMLSFRITTEARGENGLRWCNFPIGAVPKGAGLSRALSGVVPRVRLPQEEVECNWSTRTKYTDLGERRLVALSLLHVTGSFQYPDHNRPIQANEHLRRTTTNLETTIVFTPDPLCCLLYTSPSPRDLSTSRMPSSA